MTEVLTAPEIERLTVAQRLDLIALLWDSLPESLEGVAVPEWHREILMQRLADANANPNDAIPWEQVREELRRPS